MTAKQIQKETKEIMKADGLSALTASVKIGIHRNTLRAFLVATEAVEKETIAKIERWVLDRSTVKVESKV
jgi:plasmid maintenance system antidote protein VapI